MAILLDTPIQIPAKTADKLWITSFNVTAIDNKNPIRLMITVSPFVTNTTPKEIIKDMSERIFIANVESQSLLSPKLETAMIAINAAVKDLIQSQSLFNT